MSGGITHASEASVWQFTGFDGCVALGISASFRSRLKRARVLSAGCTGAFFLARTNHALWLGALAGR
jgi:hypothetical protein